MNHKILLVALVALLALAATTGCSLVGGSSPVTINDIPAYPGATELSPNDSTIANTLAKNSQQITAIGQSAGVGGKTDQKGFALPKEATWDAVSKFYADKLKSTGWSEPSSIASNILSQVNSGNDAFQTVIYQRGNQTLSIIRVTVDPTKQQVVLIFSLNTR